MSAPALLDPPSLDSLAEALRWPNRFHRLGGEFHTPTRAHGLPDAHWIAVNPEAASALGWPADWWRAPQALEVFSGNATWPGMSPIATVYSGHQFGVWAGELGDGRALLLGEVQTPSGGMEVQLKGSGMTQYSRMGDGRAVLRSSVREFLCSVAMHALNIPTTRALCLVGSPLPVMREGMESAAVVTRLAPSFVRFGHFEHFSDVDRLDALRRLADHVIEHHVPAAGQAPHPYLALLDHAVDSTARLLAQWQAVGFCHGVMNTDNMSILGLTLDYGPFGFLDAYEPMHVCNHSDRQGRYAFARQPGVALWNLRALAQSLMPLIDDMPAARASLERYPDIYSNAMLAALRAKLGLLEAHESDAELIAAWLNMLQRQRVDYTLAFRRLSDEAAPAMALDSLRTSALGVLFADVAELETWLRGYGDRLRLERASTAQRRAAMHAVNPCYVARNHLLHTAIEQAAQGRFEEIERLKQALSAPFEERAQFAAYAERPPQWACQLELSCSS